MNRTDLAVLIRKGENSGVEFKRDDVPPARLAKEMAALLNLEVGHIFLGVEKDGSVSGLTRAHEQAEVWAMEVARVHLRPAVIPFWEMLDWGGGKTVGVISVPADAPTNRTSAGAARDAGHGPALRQERRKPGRIGGAGHLGIEGQRAKDLP